MLKSSLKFFALVLGVGSMVFASTSCKKDDAKECCTLTENGVTEKICEGDSFYGIKLEGQLWDAAKASAIESGYTCD